MLKTCSHVGISGQLIQQLLESTTLKGKTLTIIPLIRLLYHPQSTTIKGRTLTMIPLIRLLYHPQSTTLKGRTLTMIPLIRLWVV